MSYDRKGWGGFTSATVTADAYFEQLWAHGVRFYDPGRQIEPLFTPKPGALATRKAASYLDLFAMADIEDFIDYDDEEGGYDDVGDDDAASAREWLLAESASEGREVGRCEMVFAG